MRINPASTGGRGAAAVDILKTLDVDNLIALLSHSDREVRGHAALALGALKERRAVDALIELLKDSETVDRPGTTAAWALGEIGDARAAGPLIDALGVKFLRGHAVEALVKLRDERAIEPLIKLFERRAEPSLATVLGNWGDRRAVGPLIDAMKHPDSHARFYAARALGKLGDRRALPILEWARDHDTEPITDSGSIRGKSVSYVAVKAIEKIEASEMPPAVTVADRRP